MLAAAATPVRRAGKAPAGPREKLRGSGGEKQARGIADASHRRDENAAAKNDSLPQAKRVTNTKNARRWRQNVSECYYVGTHIRAAAVARRKCDSALPHLLRHLQGAKKSATTGNKKEPPQHTHFLLLFIDLLFVLYPTASEKHTLLSPYEPKFEIAQLTVEPNSSTAGSLESVRMFRRDKPSCKEKQESSIRR